MRTMLLAAAISAAMAFSGIAFGQAQMDHTAKERKEDAARHRALAAVHENAELANPVQAVVGCLVA